jgi:hypothetical protein
MSLDQIENVLGPYGIAKEHVSGYLVISIKDLKVALSQGIDDPHSKAAAAIEMFKLSNSVCSTSEERSSSHRLIRIRAHEDEETFLISDDNYVFYANVKRSL